MEASDFDKCSNEKRDRLCKHLVGTVLINVNIPTFCLSTADCAAGSTVSTSIVVGVTEVDGILPMPWEDAAR